MSLPLTSYIATTTGHITHKQKSRSLHGDHTPKLELFTLERTQEDSLINSEIGRKYPLINLPTGMVSIRDRE